MAELARLPVRMASFTSRAWKMRVRFVMSCPVVTCSDGVAIYLCPPPPIDLWVEKATPTGLGGRGDDCYPGTSIRFFTLSDEIKPMGTCLDFFSVYFWRYFVSLTHSRCIRRWGKPVIIAHSKKQEWETFNDQCHSLFLERILIWRHIPHFVSC